MNQSIKTICPPAFTDKRETVLRATHWIDFLLNHPNEIGSCEAENCFKIFDGNEVAEIVVFTLFKNNITFDRLPMDSQQYIGKEAFESLCNKALCRIFIQTELSL